MLLGALFSGLGSMFTEYGDGFFSGLAIIIAGAIGARIWCELLIVLFKIHENLQPNIMCHGYLFKGKFCVLIFS